MSGCSDVKLKQLRRHFDDGLTCAQSAERLGVSRLAVLGKRQRLGLRRIRPKAAEGAEWDGAASRGRVSEDGGAAILRTVASRSAARKTQDLPEILAPGQDPSGARPLMALGPCECRWPMEATDVKSSADTRFCGRPTEPRQSFCPAHARAARSPHAARNAERGAR